MVELCESIKVVKVQMANFELYSSSPKDFRVSIGHTYPGREKDWLPYGTFLYEDERSLQTFKSSGTTPVVGKYAKARDLYLTLLCHLIGSENRVISDFEIEFLIIYG